MVTLAQLAVPVALRNLEPWSQQCRYCNAHCLFSQTIPLGTQPAACNRHSRTRTTLSGQLLQVRLQPHPNIMPLGTSICLPSTHGNVHVL